MKTTLKYLIMLIVATLLAVIFYFKIYIPKHTFAIIQPTIGDLQVSVKGIGHVNALHIYPITAQTGGKILNILTDEGQWVKKGELLVVMDGVDLPEQLEMAKAALAKTEYDVKALQGEQQNQIAQKALMQISYNRYKALNELGFATKSEYDKAQTDLQSIEAALTATSARIDSAKSGVMVASRNIKALQAKMERLNVYSPVDGCVIYKGAEVAQNVLPSTPILKVVDPRTLWVEANIDERISSQVKPLQEAIIVLRSQPAMKLKGFVKRVDKTSDAVTLERKINVAFAKLPTPFYINEQALVIINVKKYKNVLKIPLKIVVQNNGKSGMWVVKEGHAHFVTINKTAQNEDEIALANGDKNSFIIVPNRHNKALSEGMAVYQ